MPLDNQSQKGRVSVDSSMRILVGSAPTVNTSMNAHTSGGGGAHPLSRCIKSGTKKKVLARLREKGQTPVRVDMSPFLNRYPDRAAALFLWEGFTEGFLIPCSLSYSPCCG